MIRDDGTLIIKNVDYRRPTDAGRYTCVANNAVGWSSRASAYLSVRSKSYLLLFRMSSIAFCHSVMVVDKKNIQVHTKNWLQVSVKTTMYMSTHCVSARANNVVIRPEKAGRRGWWLRVEGDWGCG